MTNTGRKKKILYLMHVDWNWIKQRPHFLAEGLNSTFDVLVLYHYSSDRTVMVKNSTGVNCYPIPRIPFGRFKLVAKANELLQKLFFTILLKIYNPDIVWLTFPSLYSYVAACDMRKRTLVYDCMDNALEFIQDMDARKNIHEVEQRTLERADIVFSSSLNLMTKLSERGCRPDKIFLVRNAFDGQTMQVLESETIHASLAENSLYRICYVGTVAEYIDFAALLFCLQKLPLVEFHFYGPVVCNVPLNEKLVFHGPVNHAELVSVVSPYDCMLLPFKVNDLIRGVDPVKLYEYINYNKNIISVYYDEIERFADFVMFYQNNEELVQSVDKLSKENQLKYSQEERKRFLNMNSWDERVSHINSLLKQCPAAVETTNEAVFKSY